jgi:hypothetical protein
LLKLLLLFANFLPDPRLYEKNVAVAWQFRAWLGCGALQNWATTYLAL